MVAAPLPHRPSLAETKDHDEPGVEHGQSEDQERRSHRRRRSAGSARTGKEGEAAEREAEHVRARVAHEKRRRSVRAIVEG